MQRPADVCCVQAAAAAAGQQHPGCVLWVGAGVGGLCAQQGLDQVLEWKDYVRGKDLAKWLRERQEVLDQHTRQQSATRLQEDQVQDLVTRLLEAKLLLPADRKFKKPKPGKKKLVKYPRTLEPAVLEANVTAGLNELAKCPRTLAPAVPEWSEELFYAINYEQPWGTMFYLLSALVVVGVIGVTLFPLAPHWVRLTVLYLLSGLLSVLLGTMALRYVVWFGAWLATGAHFWLLPNMMSEELPITELFSPLVSCAAAAPDDKSSSLALRGAAAAVLAAGCYGLYAVGPNAETVKDNLQGARDSVLNYFDLVDSMRQGIGNGTNTTGIQLNNTKAAGGRGGSSRGSGTAGPAAGGAEAGKAKQQQQQQQQSDQLPAMFVHVLSAGQLHVLSAGLGRLRAALLPALLQPAVSWRAARAECRAGLLAALLIVEVSPSTNCGNSSSSSSSGGSSSRLAVSHEHKSWLWFAPNGGRLTPEVPRPTAPPVLRLIPAPATATAPRQADQPGQQAAAGGSRSTWLVPGATLDWSLATALGSTAQLLGPGALACTGEGGGSLRDVLETLGPLVDVATSLSLAVPVLGEAAAAALKCVKIIIETAKRNKAKAQLLAVRAQMAGQALQAMNSPAVAAALLRMSKQQRQNLGSAVARLHAVLRDAEQLVLKWAEGQGVGRDIMRAIKHKMGSADIFDVSASLAAQPSHSLRAEAAVCACALQSMDGDSSSWPQGAAGCAITDATVDLTWQLTAAGVQLQTMLHSDTLLQVQHSRQRLEQQLQGCFDALAAHLRAADIMDGGTMAGPAGGVQVSTS
ncbi:hypothetical protein COO60DRAFT_1702590 [Scenedesmus sp. NREL 46B-D3]|nr:hypothetical protein COO60DRAFT_1702590 [Scenedesmus sp. NREL 46B-D3]